MKRVWGIFWALMATLGANTLLSVFQLSSESKNAVLFGLSRSKLIMCGGIALLIVLCLFGAVTSLRRQENFFSDGKAAGVSAYFLCTGLLIGKIFLTPPVGRTALERSLLERLTPLAYWAFAFSAAAALLLFIQKQYDLKARLTSSPAALIYGCVLFLLMGGAVSFAIRTGIGTDPISGTFYRQGVSLLEGHLAVPLLFCIPLYPLSQTILSGQKKTVIIILTIIGSLMLWCAAVYFWQTTVFEGRSYFAPALRAPNQNFYPASDAENYDLLAQSILLGNGFRNGLTVVRPLYAAFLALLHAIFGDNYMALTNGQILLLALFPVLVFLIGSKLRHPEAGIITAVWVIWREIYSIRLTPLVQVSNSRLFMSDLPTALAAAAVILSAVQWHRQGQTSARALLCGGLIGTAMLLRTQCFILIPVLWLVFLCTGTGSIRKWRSLLLSILGCVIVFAPWTVWNQIHPNTTENADRSEGQYLQSLYRKATGETDPSKSLPEVILSRPAESFSAVAAHFLNNEISSLLVLPTRSIENLETDQLFYEENLFWYRENARETLQQYSGLILIWITMIAWGAASACRKNGFIGLAPLLFHLVYNAGNALALTSGFRFILPVDWVLLLYFAYGCTAFLDLFCGLLLPHRFNQIPSAKSAETVPVKGHGWEMSMTIFLLAAIGSILPLCDGMIPYRYKHDTAEEISAEWKRMSANAAEILSRYSENDLVVRKGLAFYPRFYLSGEGDSGGSSVAKRGLDQDRLVWMFHDHAPAVLNYSLTAERSAEISSTPIQDPMDVIVVGIPKEDYIEIIEMLPIEIEGD